MVSVVPAAGDPRARRASEAAAERGIEVLAISTGAAAGRRARTMRGGRVIRELRGVIRLARQLRTTLTLTWLGWSGSVDVVHAHDLDTLLAGWILARRHTARLVYDAHELYTRFELDPPRLWWALISRLEGALARRSDAVVTVSDAIADRLMALHSLERRPFVVLNAPRLTKVPDASHAGTLRAIYQAASGPARHLNDLPRVAGVEIAARVLGATGTPEHVMLLDPVEPDELVTRLDGFDVGLVIDRPETENARLALPNKLFEYLMAGLAVVVPDVPAMGDLVQREGVGRTYQFGRLGEALHELAEDRAAVEEMRRCARAAAVQRYNAEAQRPALYAAWGL